MNRENEEFNEKFANIEQALKYIADSQAKSEWVQKRDQIQLKKDREQDRLEWNGKIAEMQAIQANTQKQLDYITKLTGIAFEDLTFQDEKISSAGEIMVKANPKRS